MVSSQNLPSLGVLFYIIEKSKSDMIMFTLIFMFLLFDINVICHTLFGFHSENYSDIFITLSTTTQMLFGRLDYKTMYDSNPGVSAMIFIVFVYIFYFMLMYMYLAIVTRTYITMRKKKFFVSEAMARILGNNLKG